MHCATFSFSIAASVVDAVRKYCVRLDRWFNFISSRACLSLERMSCWESCRTESIVKDGCDFLMILKYSLTALSRDNFSIISSVVNDVIGICGVFEEEMVDEEGSGVLAAFVVEKGSLGVVVALRGSVAVTGEEAS